MYRYRFVQVAGEFFSFSRLPDVDCSYYRGAPRSHRDERRMPVFGNRRRRTIDLKNVLPHRALGRRVRTENRNSFSVLKVVAR